MELVQEITTPNGKRLQLIKGDLTNISEEHKVDILVVSAFPGNYLPAPYSLIGALFDAGLSVHALAMDKETDSRDQNHCWLSREIDFNNIKRILCFEPTDRTNPYSMIAGVFRSIMSYAITQSITSLAMPLILTGNQEYSPEKVVKELISTSLFWLNQPSSLQTIKIVEIDAAKVELVKQLMDAKTVPRTQKAAPDTFDFFISYSRKDSELARVIYDKLHPTFNLFFDKESIDIGTNWVHKINKSLKNSTRFIVCISPDYTASKMCKYEYLFCNLKLINDGDDYVLPVFLRNTELPFEMQILNFHDAREGLITKVEAFCDDLIQKYA